jgi:hypothetical protein
VTALEPNAPDHCVFPHPRDAIRAWVKHRTGQEPSRPSYGVRGKRATVSDVLRVGQLFVDMNLTRQQVQDLTLWAKGAKPRSAMAVDGQQKREVLIARVTRWMRERQIVANARPRATMRTDKWQDVDGEEHKSTYCVDSA